MNQLASLVESLSREHDRSADNSGDSTGLDARRRMTVARKPTSRQLAFLWHRVYASLASYVLVCSAS